MTFKPLIMSLMTMLCSLFGCTAQTIGFRSVEAEEFGRIIADTTQAVTRLDRHRKTPQRQDRRGILPQRKAQQESRRHSRQKRIQCRRTEQRLHGMDQGRHANRQVKHRRHIGTNRQEQQIRFISCKKGFYHY